MTTASKKKISSPGESRSERNYRRAERRTLLQNTWLTDTTNETILGGESLFTSTRQEREMRGVLQRLQESGIGSRATVGLRMVSARKVWGVTQDLAAGLLGYETGAQLSQIERGLKPIPSHTLCAAARLYNVSTDYLLGLTELPEPNVNHARSAAHVRRINGIVTASTEAITSAVLRSLGPPELLSTLEQGTPIIEKMVTALNRFMDRNEEEFLDMPGGAPVATAARELSEYLAVAMGVQAKVLALERLGAAGTLPDASNWHADGTQEGA